MLKQNFDVQLSENEKVPRNKGLFKIQKIPLVYTCRLLGIYQKIMIFYFVL